MHSISREIPAHCSLAAVTLCHSQTGTERRTVSVIPQNLFRGEGLWLWGCDRTTLVHSIKVGVHHCFTLTSAPIPGLFFEAGRSFEGFNRLLADPDAPSNIKVLRELPPATPHQQLRLPTNLIGNYIELDVEGPLTHAVLWGLTVH